MTKTYKNRGEPRKMTHISEINIFFGGGLKGKVVAPGTLVLRPIDKSRDSDKMIYLLPHISKFLGLKAHYCTCVFDTKKVSHQFPDMGIPEVLLHPTKKSILGPTTAQN